MAMKVKVNFLTGFAAAVYQTNTLNYIEYIGAILRGATTTATVGGTTTIMDLWSGASIRIETTGGLVDRIFVKGDTVVNGVVQTKGLIDINFTKTPPTIADLLADFDDYAANWHQGATPLQLLDGAATTYAASEGGLAVILGHDGNEIFDMRGSMTRLDPADASIIFASLGDDVYKGGAPGVAFVSYQTYSKVSQTTGGLVLSTIDATTVEISKPGGSHDKLMNIYALSGSSRGDDLSAGLGDTAQMIYGDSGKDTIGGGSSGDYLSGDAGNDLIFGRDGNDILVGGEGRDTLKGGNGDDVLIGYYKEAFNYDGKIDLLVGGNGHDLFLIGMPYSWSGSNTGPVAKIQDFKQGVDFIGLGGYTDVYSQVYGYYSVGNLAYDDLVFTDITGGTMISSNGIDLALVKGNMAADFDRSDFVEAPAVGYATADTIYYDFFG